MFGKKVLSLVNALFIGSQLISKAFADCEITCDHNISSCSINNECINGAYYSLFAENDDSGTSYVFSKTSTSYGAVIKVTDESIDAFTLINENGYYKNADDYYMTKNGATVAVVSTDPAVAPSYVSGEYYVIAKDGTMFTGIGDNAIVLAKDNAIVEKSIVQGENYIVISGVAGISPVNDVIAVKNNDDTSIDKVTSFTNGMEYCVSDSTKVITNRHNNYCETDATGTDLSAVDCDKLYTFSTTGNVFTVTTTTYTRRAGGAEQTCDLFAGTNCSAANDGTYYFIGTGDNLTAVGGLQTIKGGSGNLFECVYTYGGSPSEFVCTKKANMVGYFENADTANGIPFIKCSAGETVTCMAMEDPLNTEYNACESHTTDIVKLNGVYKQCSSAVDEEAVAIPKYIGYDCVDETTNGNLIKDGEGYKICIKGTAKIPITAASYFIATDTAHTFNDQVLTDHFVAVDITVDTKHKKIVLNNNDVKYRYAVDSTQEIKTKGNAGTICSNGSLDTSVGHEYELTIPSDGDRTKDHVNYYKKNN